VSRYEKQEHDLETMGWPADLCAIPKCAYIPPGLLIVLYVRYRAMSAVGRATTQHKQADNGENRYRYLTRLGFNCKPI
jgi:hypothetical protein